jgi:alanyl-tRNA synthetase
MEFNRMDDGALVALPAQHVDTGMGLERIVSVLQGRSSNYDTDLFTPLFARLSELTGRPYGASDAPEDVAFRVIADHVRAVSISIADGVLPSNTGRGYVLRRLVRRAARFGKQALEMEEPFLFELVGSVAEVLGGSFPELISRREHVEGLMREEEAAFGRTLGRGLAQFEELAGELEEGGMLPGGRAYELYATYGFPRDLVEQMARERGIGLDAAGWEEAQEAHRDASRSEGRFRSLLSADQIASVERGGAQTVKTCYEIGAGGVQQRAKVILCEAQPGADEERLVCVLDCTPCYPEGGGQVGDSGVMESTDGSAVAEILETKALGDTIVHTLKMVSGSAFPAGTEVMCGVDLGRRDATRRHHTATHLLHAALREVLGDHVVQQGSYVGPDRLRFDFANPGGVSALDLDRVERIVNEAIYRNDAVVTTEEGLDSAKERGVTALFGEKYEELVRVVSIGVGSMELCGGTHVSAAGQVGPFLLLSERAIQAGVRRVEAVCGGVAVAEIQTQRQRLREAARKLKATPEELTDRISALQEQVKAAKGAKKSQSKGDVDGALALVREALADENGVHWAAVKIDGLDMQGMRELSVRVKSLEADLAVALLSVADGGVPFMVLSQGAAQERGLEAGALAKELGGQVGGGGGGRADVGQGQGSQPQAVAEALTWVAAKIQAVLRAE